MKNGLLLLMVCAAMTYISCKKDAQIESLGDPLVWKETQCADPWMAEVDRNSANFEAELDSWLESKSGLSIAQPVRKKVAGVAEACSACNCKTGNVIYIFPNNAKQKKFLDMGFRKQ